MSSDHTENDIITYNVFFETWQVGENDLHALENHRILWDEFEEQQAFEKVGLPEEWQEKLYKAKTESHSGPTSLDTNKPPEWKEIMDNGPSVGLFTVWKRNSNREPVAPFQDWLNLLVSIEDGVSGDDSYFDYYPDNWWIAEQIATAMGPYHPEFKEAVLLAWDQLDDDRWKTYDPQLLTDGFLGVRVNQMKNPAQKDYSDGGYQGT